MRMGAHCVCAECKCVLLMATRRPAPPDTPATCGNGVKELDEECDESASLLAVCCRFCRMRPPTHLCRPAEGKTSGATCDREEYCDGTSAFCPADRVQPRGTVCRSAVDECDIAEECRCDDAHLFCFCLFQSILK